MKKHEINTFQKFHNIVQKYNDDTIYRGVSKSSFALLAKVGRKHCLDNYNRNSKYVDLIDYENAIINDFIKYASEFVSTTNSTLWELWAIAAHHGLPTRYLDWTKNPLIAAYFAVEDCNNEEDCVVYAVNSSQFNSNID